MKTFIDAVYKYNPIYNSALVLYIKYTLFFLMLLLHILVYGKCGIIGQLLNGCNAKICADVWCGVYAELKTALNDMESY